MEKTVVYQGGKICYQSTGNGKPVLLIHGFGEDGNVWQNQTAVLEKQYSVLVPHLPGSGTSELIADMSIEGMAGCIKAIIDAENLRQPVVLGHSMGGYITLALVEKNPQLTAAFGLIHSSAYADSEDKKAARNKSIEFIKSNGAYEFLKTAIPGLFYHPENNKDCESLVEAGKNFTAEALSAYYTAMINRPDHTQLLKTATHPILFIMGQYDKAVPFEHSLEQSHLPAQSHITILRHSAHMGMVEEAEKTTAAISGFLKQVL